MLRFMLFLHERGPLQMRKKEKNRMKSEQYINSVLNQVKEKNAEQPEFIQAVSEVFYFLPPVLEEHPDYEKMNILRRMVEPDRVIDFRVTWEDDQGNIQVNRGYRVQFNSALGPYKGGLRFRKSVNLSVMKFLSFEQCFKNALTTLPLGGAKGGSDFDPHGRSDREVMRFCQSFMTELYRHIGPDMDVPAGDVGVGEREIGYLFGQYRRIRNTFEGVLTGKGLTYGGSLVRTEATGYGLCYFVREMLASRGESMEGKRVLISGSGNVAIFACEKAQELGATVLTMSDSSGYVCDPDGIDLALVKRIKLEERGRLSAYVEERPKAVYTAKARPWREKGDIALPCAIQGELDLDDAVALSANGVRIVAEGANMPCSWEATRYFLDHGVSFAPGKASNAGGVACSGLEMSQNSEHLSWPFEKVDGRLSKIMQEIYSEASETAKRYGFEGNLMAGANITAFLKLAEAMLSQGIY